MRFFGLQQYPGMWKRIKVCGEVLLVYLHIIGLSVYILTCRGERFVCLFLVFCPTREFLTYM